MENYKLKHLKNHDCFYKFTQTAEIWKMFVYEISDEETLYYDYIKLFVLITFTEMCTPVITEFQFFSMVEEKNHLEHVQTTKSKVFYFCHLRSV